MAEDITIKITAAVENAEAAKSVGDLRKSLKELNSLALQTQGVNDKAFKQIAKAIGDTSDRMDDLRDEFVAFKGSALEKFNSTLNLTKEGFQNLDFDKVGASLKNLGAVIKANPLLILSSVVIELVQSFDKLASMGGFIGEVFTEIGKYVDQAIQTLKDMADQIGLTAFAAEEAAKRIEESNKKIAEDTQRRYDAEIEYAKAAGKETTDIEIKKQEAIIETNKKAIESMILRMYQGKKVTEEDEKRFQELKKSSEDAYKTINTLNIQRNTKEKEANEKAYEENKALRDKRKADLQKELEDEAELRRQLNIAGIAAVNEYNENLKKLSEDRVKRAQQEADEIRKIEEEQLGDVFAATEEAYNKQVALDKKNAEDAAAFKKQRDDFIQQEGLNTALMAADAIISIEQNKNQQLLEQSLTALDQRYFAEDEKLKHKLQAENLTESQFQAEKIKIEQKRRKEEEALKRNAFLKDQRLQITRLIIDGAVAVGKTFAQFGFPAGIVPAAFMAAQTGIQVGLVKSQKPAFATGGLVQGPGTGTSDSIDAKLSDGESVINANSTSMFGPLLSLLNVAGGGKSFTGNKGPGTSGNESDSNPMTKTPIVKAYVTEVDMTRSQDKAKRVDRLSSF